MLQRDFTEEQNMFRDAYRRFLATEIVPHMEAWREAGIVDREAFRKAGERGYLAAAQLSWDITADYVRERKAFGKPLAAFQNTQFKLAEMRMQLDLAQVYFDQCVRSFNAGALTAVDAAKAKLVTSELQVAAADLGVQLHDGHGYMDEYPISRQYTDARISTIYAGSSEVMKIIISRECLGDSYVPFNTRNF